MNKSFFLLFFSVSFNYFVLFFLPFYLRSGYPPPLKNMLNNLNGSNLAGNAAIFQKPDMDIQISSASSSSVVSSGSALSQKKTCPYCYQQLSWHALSRHIRDMHKAKSNFVTCKFCQKMFRNKNSLGCHMWRFHKEAKEKEKEPTESGGNGNKMLEHEFTSGGNVAGVAQPPINHLQPPLAVDNPWLLLFSFILLSFPFSICVFLIFTQLRVLLTLKFLVSVHSKGILTKDLQPRGLENFVKILLKKENFTLHKYLVPEQLGNVTRLYELAVMNRFQCKNYPKLFPKTYFSRTFQSKTLLFLAIFINKKSIPWSSSSAS